ncbi:Coproporphyrinogen III oxidase, aerobic [Cystobacter fuscus DSM 2262]|uniref:coproporphyrinogen oxidase n=1 Tax=Cystobacter fuscus (strain ATCC 25194 / DSM 2262 / NBRC 100088 / M29) TaxID=1242864 RepID=S9QX42_CYSF2|nr:oxygen-dependent coproporphyrinogen oxidase [Cystobacter fuscus]EPX61243.1 Coproporphyrinogen III oxidase, aerobic [Cystobacter fuscus DSM 2262]
MTVDLETLKKQMADHIHALQDEICGALERLDGKARFREDHWTRPGGGGGRSRVLEDGEFLEKGGVSTSVVFGELEEAFAGKLQGEGRTFWAGGLSLVLHPRNPHVPTVHANYRFIHQGSKAWFGGGADLTPYYLQEEDAVHFHRVHKEACDRHDPSYYPRYKKACDQYFYLRHREEARGVGGIFFENTGEELEREFAFVKDVSRAFLPAYLPIAERRKDTPYTEEQRAWQEVRRGRYVEFNLVWDRGTIFGLETKGRTESILMSLPPRVRWRYDYHPEPGTEEARLVEVLRRPRDWVGA